jgi:hypothetical protein
MSDTLYNTLNEEEQHVWTNDKLAKALVKIKPIITIFLRDRLNSTYTRLITTLSRLHTSFLPLQQASTNHSNPLLPRILAPAVTTQPAYTLNPLKPFTVKPAFFKIQDLPEDRTSVPTLIPTFALTFIPTSAPTLTILIVFASASAELTQLATLIAT